MEIRTLKYNYTASGIIKSLKSEGFTLYRKNAYQGRDLFGPYNLIRWNVSVPSKYRDPAGRQRWFRIIESEIRQIVRGNSDLKLDDMEWPGHGWACILSLHNKDQRVGVAIWIKI